jgi:glycosyltransferase involved in cell wall biosynthesis
MNQSSKLNVAIVYDRVNKFGGAERVLMTLHEMFPDAPLYTSVYDKENAKWADVFPQVYTSFLQNIPILKNHHELLGWLVPMAFEQFNFDQYDLVISVTSEAAKGIITGTKTLHVCYCLTPTRYLWSGSNFYLENPPKILKMFPFYKIFSWPFLTYARWWDRVASQRPDTYIAISTEVQKRIKKYYKRDSEIIFPPVELSHLKKTFLRGPRSESASHDFFEDAYHLYVGRLVKYKKVDLLVDTFNDLGLPLLIVGTGTEEKRLKASAKSNIKFLGPVSDSELVKIYQNARAFMMPQDEDFGITSVEAQSFGVPVIAYKRGGALDTVIDGKTGVFFDNQSVSSLKDAIAKFDTISFNSGYLITNAKRFGEDRFKSEFLNLLKTKI